jgi:predicted PurR-regulated permease PerM
MNEPATTMHPHVIQPVYQKLALIVLGLVAFFYGLVQAQPIVVPMLFALLLALLLNPSVNFLVRHGLNRMVGIALVLLELCPNRAWI